MLLVDGFLGEYIVLSNEVNPPICCYYKDKKILKSEVVSDIICSSKKILSKLKLDTKEVKDIQSIMRNHKLLYIVITKNGIEEYAVI